MSNKQKPCNVAQELQQTCGQPALSGFIVEGPTIYAVPESMFTERPLRRYRLDVTESQLNYLHALAEVDEGENAEELSSREYDELIGALCYHHSGIHGPDDTDDRPPAADNE